MCKVTGKEGPSLTMFTFTRLNALNIGEEKTLAASASNHITVQHK